MQRQRGFSLVEVLAALLVLAIVITTTLAMFLERNKRLRQASELILVYQALANEAEIRRRIDFDRLDGLETPLTFMSSTEILRPLGAFNTFVGCTVDPNSPDVKTVTMSVRWAGGRRVERLILVRTNTGGSNLW